MTPKARATHTTRTAALAIVLASALALGAVACSSSGSSDNQTRATAKAGDECGRELVEEGTPKEGGKLVIGLPGETDGWHPTANNWATDGHFVGGAIYETLGTFDENGQVVPYLAESIEPNDDYTVWTVTVRDGITFHDGTPLNAAAVAQNLDTAFFEGLTSLTFQDTADDAVAIDDRTVEIRLKQSLPNFDNVLAGVPGYIAAPSMLNAEDGSEHPVGTGPFEFGEWIRDGSFTATKYQDYWRKDEDGNQLPYLDEIEYRVIIDDEARRDALSTGEVDMILTVNSETVAEACESDEVQSVEDNFSEETHVMLNNAIAPFDNENARDAVAYGTDPQAIIDTVEQGVPVKAVSPWAPGTPWEPEDAAWEGYDPDKAAAALAAYTEDTGEPLKFTITGLAGNAAILSVLQVLEQQWEQLGMEVEIDTVEQTAYITQVAGGSYQAAWFRNFSFTDPDSLYVFFHSSYANGPGAISINFAQMSDPELDAALDEGRFSDDDAARKDIYNTVAQELNAQRSYVWLFHTPFALVAEPAVRGLNPPRERGFGNLEPKPWIGELWLDE